ARQLVRPPTARSVDRVFQTLAGLELGLIGSRDLDFGAGRRVTARAGFALGDGEGAETDQPNLIASLQRCGDRVEYGVHSLASLSLGNLRLIGDHADQIVFVHWVSSQ